MKIQTGPDTYQMICLPFGILATEDTGPELAGILKDRTILLPTASHSSTGITDLSFRAIQLRIRRYLVRYVFPNISWTHWRSSMPASHGGFQFGSDVTFLYVHRALDLPISTKGVFCPARQPVELARRVVGGPK